MFACKIEETEAKQPPGTLRRMTKLFLPLPLVLALFGCNNKGSEASASAVTTSSPSASASAASVAASAPAPAKAPLRGAGSDWSRWTAVEVGHHNGWFQ